MQVPSLMRHTCFEWFCPQEVLIFRALQHDSNVEEFPPPRHVSFSSNQLATNSAAAPISSRNLALWKKTSFWAGLNTAPAMDTDLRFHETVAPGLRSFFDQDWMMWDGQIQLRSPKNPGITNEKQPWMDSFFWWMPGWVIKCWCAPVSLTWCLCHCYSTRWQPPLGPCVTTKDFRVDTTVAKSLSYVGGDLILWKQGCMFSMNYAIYVQWHHLYTMVIVLVQQNF